MDRRAFIEQLEQNLAVLDDWMSGWDAFEPDPSIQLDREQVAEAMAELTDRLRENYPYRHPRYAGQMMKPPHPVAMLAYATAMQINPNNHALDGGIATSRMEREVVADLSNMLGYGETHLGHLTASGTIANLEALWIARSLHPDRAIVISDQAHYTHQRACELLQAPFRVVKTDESGQIDLDDLQEILRAEPVGTVVATAGSTALGAVDPIHEIRTMASDADVRLHVDAAYGGFFALLARADPPLVEPAPFRAIAESDSVVVDPHKHGLQPYGCGAVLFRDPSVGQFYQHDSPYTYFTSDELHLGEISLECSRAGAAAAALWTTLRCFPLEADRGLGLVLAQSRRAALDWAELLDASSRLRLVVEPELDIVSFYPIPEGEEKPRASQLSALTRQIFQRTMDDPEDPVYLATLKVEESQLAGRDPSIVWDEPTVSVIRSVLMKPEHRSWIPRIHSAIEDHL